MTIALWTFDESSGLVAHDTAGPHDATMPPLTINQPTWVTAPCAADFPK